MRSVSRAEWAILAQNLSINDCALLAAPAGVVLGVVKYLRDHADADITWDAKDCSDATRNDYLHVLQQT